MQGKVQNIEMSAELPVEQLYNQSVEAFKRSYAELQRGGENLPAVEAALRSMGVECDNDASMFVMGAVGKVGVDAASDAFGIAANSPATTAADIAGTMYSMADEARKPGFKRAAASNDQKPVFKRAPKAAAAPVAPRKFATNLLMAAGARMTAKKKPEQLSEAKRTQLKKSLEENRQTIETLAALKSCGYKYARRVTMMDNEGQRQTMLIPVGSDTKVAFTPKAQPGNRVDMDQKFDMRPSGTGQTQALRMAM